MEPTSNDHPAPSLGEFAAIARWCTLFPTEGEHVAVGPGDDAAWLRWAGDLAISTDSFVEDVHFRRSWGAGEAVGRRALAAALSDLAASRAQPIACVVAISAPAWDAYTDAVMAGVADGARKWGCPVIGGDSTRSDGGLFLNITVLGKATAAGPLLRSGAQVGDLVQLSGLPGPTSRAIERLLAGEQAPWPTVQPRFDLLDDLASAHAGIDLSDGLLADAEHLAIASGLGIELDRNPAWDRHVLCGGEDYELLVTAPSLLRGFFAIGRVTSEPGLTFSDGSPLPPRPWGFIHNEGGAA